MLASPSSSTHGASPDLDDLLPRLRASSAPERNAAFAELSMKEIAEALELTVPNVKTRLHRARLAVREELDAYLAGRE